MTQNILALKKYSSSLFIGLLPFSVYGLSLVVQIPASISQNFAHYSFLYFLVILSLYYLSFQVKGKYDWLPGACLTAFIFAMGLSYLWTSGFSNDMLIGGLLPFKDGFYYYFGARLLSAGQLLNVDSFQSAWRPLYPGFISSLLLLSRYNLQLVLAIQLGFLATCCYASAYLFRNSLGKEVAALYITFLYFYIQSMIGFLYTELLGLTIGSLGLILLWNSAKTKKIPQLVFGLVVLMVAVSVRAGTFFIFPMLALWAGWAFRKNNYFSFSTFAISILTISVTFVAVNIIYNYFVVEPGLAANGNFAFTIYGQVIGGAGYNAAIKQFGRNHPEIVYRAAWRFFQEHPLSFFIGAAKAYRDFFLTGIFSYYSSSGRKWWDVILSVSLFGLTILGIIKSVRNIKVPFYSFVLAAFIGFFLSIPFLPPKDGGVRFYASTVPFFFLVPSIALGSFIPNNEQNDHKIRRVTRLAEFISTVIIALTVLTPILTQRTIKRNAVEIPDCPADQLPFAVQLDAGSFIDLAPDNFSSCEHSSEICMETFRANSEMLDLSDFYVFQELTTYAEESGVIARVFPGNEIITESPGLFIGDAIELRKTPNNSLIAGCATVVDIDKRPPIYEIISFYQP